MHIFRHKMGEYLVHHTLDIQPNESNFPLHAHRHCEIYYFISGKGHYTVEGRDYPLSTGSVLLMRDGETHKLHISPDIPYERISIHFALDDIVPEDGLFATLRSLFLDHPPGRGNAFSIANIGEEDFIAGCFNRICRPARDDNEFRMRLGANLIAILTELQAHAETAIAHAPRATEESAKVAEIIDYINKHLTEIKGLAELEERFFFSKSTLGRMFLRSTGSTVWEFVTIKRLLAARRMIHAGKSAALSAAACGFGDYSAFYRQYRRAFGESPRRERKKDKKIEQFT
ncbi:MAG: helix-turn-helix transcriptional regulator [Clostridia bacterium]|nr:helix-turn-helix transcriptional regulator [Clostridia bacterium]